MALQDQSLVLVHFDGVAAAESPRPGVPDGQVLNDAATARYGQWSDDREIQLRVLLPMLHGNGRLRPMEVSPGCATIWYSADGQMELPQFSDAGVWVINGALMPVVNWDAADAAARRERHRCDVLVFGPPGGVFTSQYPESIIVDAAGQVQRVERHYFDSPAFTKLSVGPVAFLFTAGSHARSVLEHIVAHGWGLTSIRALAGQVNVEWCTAPGVLSSTAGVPSRVGAIHAFPGVPAPTSNSNGHGPTDHIPNARTDSALLEPAPEVPCPPGYQWGKRILDVTLSAIGLIVLAPLLLIIALLIKVTSRGPVFFADRRQGLGGREFNCLKFRTMVPDAAKRQDELRALNEVDGPQFKISDDPRLTRIGPWLRRYNIDELPQLFNVLRGQMSLVGPRPSPDRENQLCPGWRRTRLSVKPGITGLWQVLRLRSAGPSDFQEWIYYDVEYARHRSLWLDWQLLIYTPLTMFAPLWVDRLAQKLAARGICSDSGRNRTRHETQGGGLP